MIILLNTSNKLETNMFTLTYSQLKMTSFYLILLFLCYLSHSFLFFQIFAHIIVDYFK